jgi:hypothetical protein
MTAPPRRGFLADGTPDGLRIVEKSNWIGRAVVVLAGSQVAKDTVPSAHRYLVTLRQSLTERGIIIPDGYALKLAQDYTFDSPSTAAGVLLGRSSNGRTDWKDAEGKTLKQIQTSEVDDPGA